MKKKRPEGPLVRKGIIGNFLRAAKDINPGDSIDKNSYFKSEERFNSASEMPDSINDIEVLVELTPIKKISKGEFFYSSCFDSEELETALEAFYKKNEETFEERMKLFRKFFR